MAKGRSKALQTECPAVALAGTTDTGASSRGAGGKSAPAAGRRKRKHYTGRAKGADETRRLAEARAKMVGMRGKIQQFARELVQDTYGEQGPEWGTKFRDIEILGDVIGAEVAGRFTESSVSEQAEALPDKARICPCCGGDGERQEDDEPRSLQTLTGVVNWEEAEFFCDACRRSFFPSELRSGD